MYLNINNITIYYEKFGTNKNTILILPGWGNTRKTFYPMIEILKENYTVYILDYPGFDNSPIPNKELTIYNYASLLITFMNKLNIKNPYIIAHSFGGRIATLLNSYYNIEIDKMIFIDTAGIKPKKTIYKWLKEKIYKLLKQIIKLFPKIRQKKLKQKLLNLFASSDYKSLPPTMHNTFKNIVNEDLTKYLSKIKSEVLLIWGKKDQDTPLQDAYKMRKLIPNSELIILPEGTHFSYLEYPVLIIKIIYNYFI